MIDLQKKKLSIIIKKEAADKFLFELGQTITRTIKRMVISEEIFNDPETITDVIILLELLSELSPTKEQLAKTFTKEESTIKQQNNTNKNFAE